MNSVMITVRFTSTSSGSGYPRKVYNARLDRMGDVMGLNGARVEPKKMRKHNRRKERKRNENKIKMGWGGEGNGTKDQVQYPGFVETRKYRNSAKKRGKRSEIGIRRGGNQIC